MNTKEFSLEYGLSVCWLGGCMFANWFVSPFVWGYVCYWDCLLGIYFMFGVVRMLGFFVISICTELLCFGRGI